MICIKFDQKTKFWTFEVFLRFKKTKNLGVWSHFQPWYWPLYLVQWRRGLTKFGGVQFSDQQLQIFDSKISIKRHQGFLILVGGSDFWGPYIHGILYAFWRKHES